jgi:hypothetical protein
MRVGRHFSEHFEFWLAAVILAAAWFYYPFCRTGPTLCIWKMMLGVACPGCGLTRGVCALLHGEWADAVRANPLSLLAGGILLCNLVCGAWSFFLAGCGIDYRRGSAACGILLRGEG